MNKIFRTDRSSNDDRAVGFQAHVHEASELLQILSCETRLLILLQLTNGEHSVPNLANTLGISATTISQQLTRLRRQGIVQSRQAGAITYYRLTNEKLKELLPGIFTICFPNRTRQAPVQSALKACSQQGSACRTN